MKQAVLNMFKVKTSHFLGWGGEAWVYALDFRIL